VNSDGLTDMKIWRQRLESKMAGKPLLPPYDGVPDYKSMRPEVRLLFDVLLDVTTALAESETKP
jgi:hypothetical protein